MSGCLGCEVGRLRIFLLSPINDQGKVHARKNKLSRGTASEWSVPLLQDKAFSLKPAPLVEPVAVAPPLQKEEPTHNCQYEERRRTARPNGYKQITAKSRQ